MSGGPASNSGVPEPPASSPAAAAPSSVGQALRPRWPTSMAEEEPPLDPHSSPNLATTPQPVRSLSVVRSFAVLGVLESWNLAS